MAGGVAGEEDAVLGRRAELVRDPVALVAHGVRAQVLGQLHGVVLHVEARVEGADADAQLVARGEAPAVARRARYSRSIQIARSSPEPSGCTSSPRDSGASGRLEAAVAGQHPPPAQRVHDQRRGQVAAVGVHRVAGAAVDLGGLELAVGLLEQQRAQLAVVEGGEGPGQRPARRAVRRGAPPARRRSGGASPSGPAPRATPWGCRRPRSGARRPRSGRSSARARGAVARASRPARAPRPGRRSSRRRSSTS